MKKILTILFLTALTINSYGQAKKYLMFEHFTNTNCSICANQNPQFFETIEEFENDIHHIAYHPPFPYTQCVFYQANKEENSARAEFYSIFGTPNVMWQGDLRTSPRNVKKDKIEERLAETSPIEVIVEETGDTDRTVKVTIRTVGEKPTGNLKLLVSIAEKIVDYSAPNGEGTHHNVFRETISNSSGDLISFAATGGEVSYEFNYSVDSEWDAEQVYALAFVQDFDFGNILNSGTRFDERTTSTQNILADHVLNVFPNPVSDYLEVRLKNITGNKNSLELFTTTGQLILQEFLQDQASLNLKTVPAGIYLLKLNTEEGVAVKRITIQ